MLNAREEASLQLLKETLKELPVGTVVTKGPEGFRLRQDIRALPLESLRKLEIELNRLEATPYECSTCVFLKASVANLRKILNEALHA